MTTTSTFDSWLFRPRRNAQASLRLFCCPYAGGSTQIFHAWPHSLPPTIEVCPIELPGRGTRLQEPPFTRLLPLVQVIAQELLPHLDKPFALFGHSMGALVSFELARQLRRQHSPEPIHLFVSGAGAPHTRNPDPPVHELPEAAFMAELSRLNGTPKAVLEHQDLMQLMLPVLRADFAVCETYAYSAEPPLDCPISVFAGWQDAEVSRDRLEAWRDQTTGGFSLRMLPGDHFFLHTAQPLLLRILSQELQHLVGSITERLCP
jgi:medium-chain acyl-[acyl-carrier-protein] hydrolase